MDDSLETLAQILASAIEKVWESEWMRDDLALSLCERYNKQQVKAIAGTLGRSHQDLYRWAARAAETPPEARKQDRSPRTHAAEAKRLREALRG